jgi:hypothetical protein
MTHTKWMVDRSGFNVIEQLKDGVASVAHLQPHARMKERAALIVKAVNCHHELVDVAGLLAAWDQSDGDPALISEACSKARAALAKAAP